MATKTIGISLALSEMEEPGRQFMLHYIKGSGKDRGRRVIFPRCVYGSPAREMKGKVGKAAQDASAIREDYKKKYVDHGLLPITRLDTGKFETIKISHITRYDLQRIQH